MKKIVGILIVVLTVCILSGCKYFVGEYEEDRQSPFGDIDFEGIQKEQMWIQRQQMQQMQRSIRGGGGGSGGRGSF